MSNIRIEYPSIDEAEFEGNPVLRGVIRTEDLKLLCIDGAYQREILSSSTRRHILEALASRQRLPDLELGMRGESWDFEAGSSEFVSLKDPVFIIDGQQRRATILEFLENNPNETVRQGALIHFGTTMEWERERFHNLNLHQTSVSSGIILRNLRSTNPGVATLYGLTKTERNFPLYDRVAWSQSLLRKDLLSANLYTRTVLWTHGHMGGGISASSVQGMSIGLDRLVRAIGLPQLRANVQEYWKSIDRAWGIRNLTRRGAPWMTYTFLSAYSDILSDHYDFWSSTNDQNVLKIPSTIISKLEKFPLNDPEIRSLATSSGISRVTLQFHLENWLNRYSPLTKRDVVGTTYKHKAEAARRVGKAIRENLRGAKHAEDQA